MNNGHQAVSLYDYTPTTGLILVIIYLYHPAVPSGISYF